MDHTIKSLHSQQQPAVSYDNASLWHNLLNLTSTHLGVNVSRLAPSLEDLILAGPRMVMKLGRFGSFMSLPDAIDSFGQRVIPDATTSEYYSTAPAALETSTLTTPPYASATPVRPIDEDLVVHRFSMESAKGLSSVFSYATSKWALCCIAMAVVLNRTHIFAAQRRRLRLSWPVRLLIRFIPLMLFYTQGRSLLQSIQCQTSPNFAELRWGNASKTSDLNSPQHNSLLHWTSSSLLLGATDEESCQAVHMIPIHGEGSLELRGSLSLLWPLFGSFCLSQFLETISCAVQGRTVSAETGMTLFEHSLAFAEADAAIGSQLGWGLFGLSMKNTTSQSSIGPEVAINRSIILKRVNTPPEVLLIAFFSTMSHMTSHILGVFGKQAQYRLVSTGFWALCFMGSIIWSATTFSLEDPTRQTLLRYPTVCIIGFIPHVLVMVGIVVCFTIYTIALVLSALATPANTGQSELLTFMKRIEIAHSNMQANPSFSDMRITREMDFYTALLRTGFGAITMATEAVYLNEDREVGLKRMTWLEEDRFRELETLKMNWISSGVPGSRYDTSGIIGLIPVKDGEVRATSGYARERAAQQLSKPVSGEWRAVRDGIGAAERSGRWLSALDYVLHINRLVLTTWAMAVCWVLSVIGVRQSPRWLRNWSKLPKSGKPQQSASKERRSYEAVVAQGISRIDDVLIPRSDRIDVERELRQQNDKTGDADSSLDSKLYNWWLLGGWWGKTDTSGDYAPDEEEAELNFDATSVITSAESDKFRESDDDDGFGWEDNEDNEDGQCSPTQRSAFALRESSPSPIDMPIEPTDLAALLHPRSAEDREQARTLAAHLSSDRIMTRASYHRYEQAQRTKVLFRNRSGRAAAKMSPDEEMQMLEQILLERRAATRPTDDVVDAFVAQQSSWANGAAGMGPDGPQCVVCQSSPRTIIVWPCRCLSLCDDCRVSLAMNNFDKCVCCRREVISFSRIYVP